MLSPERQAEIAELTAVLAGFRPTIAVEAGFGDRRIQRRYADYPGNYELTRNEIDQLGFRLASQLGTRSTTIPTFADARWASSPGKQVK